MPANSRWDLIQRLNNLNDPVLNVLNLNFWHILEKYSKIRNIMKIRPVGAELFHGDGRTDGHGEVNSRFSKFCEGSKKLNWFNFFDFCGVIPWTLYQATDTAWSSSPPSQNNGSLCSVTLKLLLTFPLLLNRVFDQDNRHGVSGGWRLVIR